MRQAVSLHPRYRTGYFLFTIDVDSENSSSILSINYLAPNGNNGHATQLKEQINNVDMVMSPLWRGPANIQGFILDGKSY